MKVHLRTGAALIAASLIFTGCVQTKKEENKEEVHSANDKQQEAVNYQTDPETFALDILIDGAVIPVSKPMEGRKAENYSEDGGETKWSYAEDKTDISITAQDGYLAVNILSKTDEDHEFSWPSVSGQTYYMPYGEGKRIPADDPVWRDFFSQQELDILAEFSMPFWAVAEDDYAVVYILENPYRSTLHFSDDGPLTFTLNHQYPAIDEEKENSFRIYVTENKPASIAKIYRDYVKEKGKFVTLEEKEKDNPNIKKLYGAPHIYLFGENLLSPEDVNWQAFRSSLDTDIMKYILEYTSKLDAGEDMAAVMKEISAQDYISDYQKNAVCRFLSQVLKEKDFFDKNLFSSQDAIMEQTLQEGKQDEASVIQINKHALAANLPDVFSAVDTWMNAGTVDIISDLKKSGIDQAWIGLNSWEQAFGKTELTKAIVEEGYLAGTYDSYHSIHKPGEEQWITAAFSDETLYEEATVSGKDGEKIYGFQNVGRMLNPTLSIPAVEQRMKDINSTGVEFNSWFIDCDATGEIFDDYSKEHTTTQQQDLKARLERMKLIRDDYNMVIGSEGGNDFAASTIAFAHGIEMKTFSWRDDDMKKNKESEYYIGKWYNPLGGVPEHFAKRVPVKQELSEIFVNQKYDIPLFKLVYNDSVITSYHWDWSTFKIIGEVKDRMLREVLYNVPPLYTLDDVQWEQYKSDIVNHTKVWSAFSKEVINKEMTDFQNLKEDGTVQMCKYGEDISVTANFSDESFSYNGEDIPAHALLINNNGASEIYAPKVSAENQ